MARPVRALFGSEPPGAEVGERLLDFCLRVHDKRPSERDWLAQRTARKEEKTDCCALRLDRQF